MAKVIMTCGRICCGKSTYADKLRRELNAVVLSIDEVMLAVFGRDAGDKHDEYAKAVEKLLLAKSAEIVKAGVDVILDWGFWTREKRRSAKEFYNMRHIKCELHYLDINDSIWKKRIEERNSHVMNGESDAYFVDEGLFKKFMSVFEAPDKNEIDVLINI